ncbi:MAG: substrate-binding domain-containing protein [Spirochaetales bacterium]|nr:substrate-binding domain-containing protein [Spirochaetales bacterium]
MSAVTMREFDKVFGVITAGINDSYQAGIWRGIVSKTEESGTGLVSFLGSRINSPHPDENNSNIVYSLVGKNQIDGLIIISSAISTYVEPDQLARLLEPWSDIPRVSLGLAIPGIPSVTVEGRKAIGSIVKHLIHDHKRRCFGLISGPRYHEESRLRMKSFYEFLESEGIPTASVPWIEGDFNTESGRQCVSALLDSEAEIDALFCLNDNMALGAMEELISRGYRVPEDISIFGFDGIAEAQFFNPPLTTVRQPLFEMGAKAVEMLFQQLEGKPLSNIRLSCSPLIGESCGCKSHERPFGDGDFAISSKSRTYTESEINQLKKTVLEGREQDLLELLSESLGSSLQSPSAIQSLQSMLFAAQKELLLSAGASDRDRMAGISDLIARGVSYLNRQMVFSLSSRRLKEYEQNSVTRSFGAYISEAFDKDSILNRVKEGLSLIGYSEGYMGIMSGWGEENRQNRDRWELFHLSEEVRYLNSFDGGIRQLPDALHEAWGRSRCVIKPLVSESDIFGIIILPVKTDDPGFYDIISKQIASTLKGYHLMEQVKQHERGLEAEVEKRTGELIRTNTKLQSEVELRTRLERDLIEISNETMNRIGQDLHDDLCQHLAGISMLTKVLGNSLPEGSAASDTVEKIANMLGDSIERARNISRGLVTIGLAENDFVATIDSLIESLKKSSGLPISLIVGNKFSIEKGDRRIQLYRIIQEALSNAIKHSGCSRIVVDMGMIKARTGHRPSADLPAPGFYVRIEDDGVGFVKPAKSSGMGLQIMEYRAEKACMSLDFQKTKGGGTTVLCTAIC